MEFSELAMYEAALIQADTIEEEWADLVRQRPSPEGALAARRSTAERADFAVAVRSQRRRTTVTTACRVVPATTSTVASASAGV